jgi:hypothetical protein
VKKKTTHTIEYLPSALIKVSSSKAEVNSISSFISDVANKGSKTKLLKIATKKINEIHFTKKEEDRTIF